jgi:histidine ammonia-lyase/tyrosine ammonia-lyase
LFCGFEGGQYLATSIASENLDLAAPASVKSLPSNGQNQEIVSMGLIAARKSLTLCDNVGSILAVLCAAPQSSVPLHRGDKLSPAIRELNEKLRGLVPRYEDQLPVSFVIDKVRSYVLSADSMAFARSKVDLDSKTQRDLAH